MKRLLILLVALVLAGCSTLPTSGPVNATKLAEVGDNSVNFYANGPVDGASPEEIVQGFLTASAAGMNDDFAVARQFLSAETSSSWIPLQQVRVYSDSRVPALSRSDTGAVRLDVGSEAIVNSRGQFTESRPDSVISTEFSLGRNSEGEWRIISLENGLLLSSTVFTTQYTQVPLYFLTSDQTGLVADVRWLPQNTLATNLTRQLVAGPSPWLADAAGTAFPEGTTLGTSGVSIENGVLSVSLTSEVLGMSQAQRGLMAAQLEATASVLPGIQDVEITVDGAPLEIGQKADLASYPYVQMPLLALVDGQPVEYSAGKTRPLSMSSVPENLTHVARGYGEDSPIVAISNEDNLITLPDDGSGPATLLSQPRLMAPSVDRYGWVWTGTDEVNGYLTVVQPGSQPLRVNARWLTSVVAESVHVSREGSRLAIVVEAEGRSHVLVAGIARNSDGRPTRLTEPIEIAGSLAQVSDLAWIGDASVIILGTRQGATNVGLYPTIIGGPMSTLNEVNGAVSVTGGNSEGSIIVGTESGGIVERSGGAWSALLTNATSPALPG